MDDLEWRDHIVSGPGVLGGKPVLKGTRLSVEFVLALLAGRWDQGAIAVGDRALTSERVRAVLS